MSNSLSLSNYNGFEVQCNGMANGTAGVTPGGGTAPYTYSWSTGATTQNVTGLQAGSYWAYIIDANGCRDSLIANLNEPPQVTASISSTPASCATNNGTATLTPNTGTAPFTYSWSSGQSGALVLNLAQGWYYGTVTDNQGCSTTDSVYVDTLAMLVYSFSNIVQNDCPGNAIGQAEINIAGGLSPYTYQWSEGNSTTAQGTNLPGGTVMVTITDATGCVITASTDIPEVGGCAIELPNGFSPNGDGYNDGYVIKNIEGYPSNRFQVFNRWGNLVYEKDNYTNPDWIGQNQSGEDLPEGTYFVMIELNGLDVRKNTYVDLRRMTTR
jgi:gliding motility-associated-like protein